MNVVYAPRALRDLEKIAKYLVEQSPAGANKASVDALAFFPEIGRSVDEAGHRRLSVLRFPYAIFYRVMANELLILHVRHTSREPIDPAVDL